MRRDDLTAMLPLRDEIVVDSFAGGGGASTGIESALGRPVDVAINHEPQAIAMHRINHPSTTHYTESVFKVDPEAITGNQPVGLLWASPDCTHHSKAKGGAPRSPRVRGLAWVVIRWARRVKPRVIMLENVEEFEAWGPLLGDGRPCPDRRGTTFHLWINQLRSAGYAVEWRQLRACDYGAPTTRKRLFVAARRDGLPIVWPRATHGPGLRPYRAAAECIDWSIPCPSIFERARPLADATLRRVAKGVQQFVIAAEKTFIVGVQHFGEVSAFLTKYYGCGVGQSLHDPLHTVTSHDRYGLVTVAGDHYQIADIGLRMLSPRELFNAQGFPAGYQIGDDTAQGLSLTKAEQVRMCGNSVAPPVAAALVAANLGEMRIMRTGQMPISQRPRHRHNRRKTSSAPMHMPPHPVQAWRTFEPLYGLLQQLQTGSIDAVQGKPVMRAWESNELVEVVPALDGWICCWKRIVSGESLAIDLKPMLALYRNLKYGVMLQDRHLLQAKDCTDACYQAYLRIPRGRMIEYSKTEQIQIELESLGIVETQECTA